MKSVKILTGAFLIMILVAGVGLTVEKPTWLTNGLYMTYEQLFVWSGFSETRNMTWRMTKVEGSLADIRLTSYTINSSDSTLYLISVSSNFTVNVDTRNITASSDRNLIGGKWPFWIETTVNFGSQAETYFGVATISGSELIPVLGQQRGTWTTQQTWPTSSMKRWYDVASGIVLKMHVTIQRGNTQITVAETAKWTNINLPPSEMRLQDPWAGIWPFALAAIIVAVIVLVAAFKWKMSRQRPQKVTQP